MPITNRGYPRTVEASLLPAVGDRAENVIERVRLGHRGFVVQFGSGEPEFLEHLASRVQRAVEIPWDSTPFGPDAARLLARTYGRADLVIAYDTPTEGEMFDMFLGGVPLLLAWNGTLILDNRADDWQPRQSDSVLSNHGLRAFDAEDAPSRLRTWAAHAADPRRASAALRRQTHACNSATRTS